MIELRTVVSLLAAMLVGIGTAAAQIDAPVFSSSGAVLADGTILVLGQFAVGPVGNATDTLSQGALPCWVVERDCPGDLDGNQNVDLQDLATLLAHFGTISGSSPEDGDIDGDGDVDLQDIANLLSNFGAACS